ncbi:SRPBCC family protein [Ruficoccus sp. ZRK36]|uniref:SRPBCC family protein n=1 Tax=Ruficoccus sp. ZRK36 TaxID=2866311 RepID=UPI001C7359D5|nr:SRPBCC family protein [Ruficoccus sp. ZRK36]QYY34548.1 SRPBCC family protein [Ruficoccus sp. ZRK36]
MKLRESITIRARPEAIWVFLEDPDLMREWNPKLLDCEHIEGPKAGQGATYRACYRMGSKEMWCIQRLSDYDPPTSLGWHITDPENDRLDGTRLRFTLKRTRQGIRVKQEIEFPDALIPTPVRWLIRLIMAVGKPQGELFLAKLKRTVEEVDKA